MDKLAYSVSETPQKSQLPDESDPRYLQTGQAPPTMAKVRDPAVKRRLNAQSDHVKQLLIDVTIPTTMEFYLESLEVKHATIWQAASRLVGEERTSLPLQSPNGAVYSAECKAEIFAASMEEHFTIPRSVSDAGHTTDAVGDAF